MTRRLHFQFCFQGREGWKAPEKGSGRVASKERDPVAFKFQIQSQTIRGASSSGRITRRSPAPIGEKRGGGWSACVHARLAEGKSGVFAERRPLIGRTCRVRGSPGRRRAPGGCLRATPPPARAPMAGKVWLRGRGLGGRVERVSQSPAREDSFIFWGKQRSGGTLRAIGSWRGESPRGGAFLPPCPARRRKGSSPLSPHPLSPKERKTLLFIYFWPMAKGEGAESVSAAGLLHPSLLKQEELIRPKVRSRRCAARMEGGRPAFLPRRAGSSWLLGGGGSRRGEPLSRERGPNFSSRRGGGVGRRRAARDCESPAPVGRRAV